MDFERLKQRRADEWREKQQESALRIRELTMSLRESEDVQQKPPPDKAMRYAGVQCPVCSKDQFLVSRWVTVNGKKTKMAVTCTGCTHRGTYDWEFSRWLGP